MFVCCECCVSSGRVHCDGLITRPEESYRLWRVVVYDQKNLEHEEAKARYGTMRNTTTMGCNAKKAHQQTYKTEQKTITM
jgi:hypothetical protein